MTYIMNDDGTSVVGSQKEVRVHPLEYDPVFGSSWASDGVPIVPLPRTVVAVSISYLPPREGSEMGTSNGLEGNKLASFRD